MGAINNAFNQAAGAVTGAGLVIQHAKETDFSKMNSAENSALAARNQYRDAKAEANEAYHEASQKDGLIDQLAKAEINETHAKKAYIKAKNRKNGSIETRLKKFDELDAAKKAANALRDKYKAVGDLLSRAKEQRVHAEKATQLAKEAQQKYQSRWGGK